jgi:Protein of unknown function (DUF2971)
MTNNQCLYSDDALFHFTNRITLIEKIIPSEFFLLNQLQNTNDPQEYKNYEFHATVMKTDDEINNLIRIKEVENEINLYYKNYVQIGCFCNNKIIEGRRNWLKPKIWSDFGDGHQGVCLIFSKEAISAELKRIKSDSDISNIEYTLQPLMLPAPDIIKYTNSDSKEYCYNFIRKNVNIIFNKDCDYVNENEVRCFVISKNTERIKINLNEIIKGIIIGDRFPCIYDFIINDFAEKMKIDFFKLDYQKGVGYHIVRYR